MDWCPGSLFSNWRGDVYCGAGLLAVTLRRNNEPLVHVRGKRRYQTAQKTPHFRCQLLINAVIAHVEFPITTNRAFASYFVLKPGWSDTATTVPIMSAISPIVFPVFISWKR
jgi:hypothetical protein